MSKRIQMVMKTAGVEKARRMVYGYAMVCKVDGQPYDDTQDDRITETEMIDAALDFAKNSQGAVNDMHDGGPDQGTSYFVFPMTEAIAKSLDMTWTEGAKANKHGPGMLVGAQLSPEAFALVEKGARAMWSVEGECDRVEVAS